MDTEEIEMMAVKLYPIDNTDLPRHGTDFDVEQQMKLNDRHHYQREAFIAGYAAATPPQTRVDEAFYTFKHIRDAGRKAGLRSDEVYKLIYHLPLAEQEKEVPTPTPVKEEGYVITGGHVVKGDEDAIAFAGFIHTHCEWVSEDGGIEDVWGWETDLEEYKGLYTDKRLYEIFKAI